MRIFIVLVFVLFATTAVAQQTDPQKVIVAYRQLLQEANDRVAALGAKVDDLMHQLEEAKKAKEDTKK